MGTCQQQEIPSLILRIDLTHIFVQEIYIAIQSDLIHHKHHHFIYYLQTFLRIFKFGYLASTIVINSSLSSCALKLCAFTFSLQSLTIYGPSITISESSVGTIKNTENGYIDTCLLSTLALGLTKHITRTNLHASSG